MFKREDEIRKTRSNRSFQREEQVRQLERTRQFQKEQQPREPTRNRLSSKGSFDNTPPRRRTRRNYCLETVNEGRIHSGARSMPLPNTLNSDVRSGRRRSIVLGDEPTKLGFQGERTIDDNHIGEQFRRGEEKSTSSVHVWFDNVQTFTESVPSNIDYIDEELGDDQSVTEEHLENIEDCIRAMHRFETSSSKGRKKFKKMSALGFVAKFTRDRPPLERDNATRMGSNNKLLECLDNLQEHIRDVYQRNGLRAANIIIEELAEVHLLIKTIILITDEEDSEELMSHPCIRRVLCNKGTALSHDMPLKLPGGKSSRKGNLSRFRRKRHRKKKNSWILKVLRGEEDSASKKEYFQRRVVDYLEKVSNYTVLDYIGVLLTREELEAYELEVLQPTTEIMVAYEDEREELFGTILGFNMLVPLLFSLKNDEMERAASTSIVQAALNSAVQRPYMIGQVFMDVLFYITLLLVVRNAISVDIQNSGLEQELIGSLGKYTLEVLGPPSVGYFVSRNILDLLAFTQISRAMFRQNLFFRWTVVDNLVITMIFISMTLYTYLDDESRQKDWYITYQSTVLGLVWLKALGFMQNLNPQLASFVICFFEMIRDIGQMLFVLLVMVLGFGDMFHTTYIPYRNDVSVCPNFNESSYEPLAAKLENRWESPFCTGKRTQSYLGVYRMIVGDINYNDFNANTFTSILFVLVTFITIIFLLNMLIAIIVESYEKSQKRSQGLFGRTRVAFVSKMLLMEEALMSKNIRGHLTRLFFGSIFAGINLYMAYYSFDYYYDFRSENDPTAGLSLGVAIITCVLMLYYFVVVFVYHFEGLGKRRKNAFIVRLMVSMFKFCLALPVSWVTRTVMGIPHDYRLRQMLPKQEIDGSLEARTNKGVLRTERRVQKLEHLFLEQYQERQRMMKEMHAMEARILAKCNSSQDKATEKSEDNHTPFQLGGESSADPNLSMEEEDFHSCV